MAGLGGLVGTLLGWMGYQVGQTTDAGSASGSVHAKLKYINDTLIPANTTTLTNNINLRQKPRGPVSAGIDFTTSSTSYVTALSVSGAGRVVALGTSGGSSAGYPTVKITVDGYLFCEAKGLSNSTAQHPNPMFPFCPSGGATTGFELADATNDVGHGNCQIEFKTSLLIQLKTSNYGADLYCQYVKE